jgi:hypothetical protein
LTIKTEWQNISSMSKKLRRLKVPIPLDYAGVLEYDPSNLSHINAGRRRIFTIPEKGVQRIVTLMEAAKEDGRLQGLELLDLLPELEELLPYL